MQSGLAADQQRVEQRTLVHGSSDMRRAARFDLTPLKPRRILTPHKSATATIDGRALITVGCTEGVWVGV